MWVPTALPPGARRARELGSGRKGEARPLEDGMEEATGFRAVETGRGWLRGPPEQGESGRWTPLSLPLAQRHPPESPERPLQATGWDVGEGD